MKVGSAWTKASAQLLLLGTFHFREYAGILRERRQREIEEVVELLAAFQPTKVAIERRPELQDPTDRDFQAYLDHVYSLGQNEIDQLGFRLARMTGARLCCVDAWDRYYDPPLDIEQLPQRTLPFWEIENYLVDQVGFNPWGNLEEFARSHSQKHLLSEWEQRISTFYQERAAYLDQNTLRAYLAQINREEEIWQSHAPFLVGRFKIGTGNEFPGPDLVVAWYTRNLRIFANLQRITTPVDRILLIIGYGHLPILRHCALASPEHELVEAGAYLGNSRAFGQ